MTITPEHVRQLASNLHTRRSVLAGAGVGVAAALGGLTTHAQSPVADGSDIAGEYPIVPRVFESGFNFDFLIALGFTFERGADIGECFAVASRIEDGNYESWVSEWLTMADRLNEIGETAEAAGHMVSASEAFLRASTYYGAAQWLTLGTANPEDITDVWMQHRDAFESFLRTADFPAEKVEIPYQPELPLPAYALLVDDSGAKRPWVILTNGSDGGYTESWAAGAAAALRRGYNALIYDGPGQNAMLFEKNIPFIANWETVVTPVVDYLLTRDDVDPDKLVLTGVSQGGYWVPRAAAFEHRLAALVPDGGVMQVWQSWAQNLPPEIIEGLQYTTGAEQQAIMDELDEGLAELASQDSDLAFTVAFRTYPFGTDSLAEAFMGALEMDLTEVAAQITTPILICNPDNEQFWPGQPQQLYDSVRSEIKDIAHFSAQWGGDLHCEIKAMGWRNQVVFDWLDEVLGR